MVKQPKSGHDNQDNPNNTHGNAVVPSSKGCEIMSKTVTRREISAEGEGVHWGWWVFWLLAFWPALIVVLIVHIGKKSKQVVIETTETNNEIQ